MLRKLSPHRASPLWPEVERKVFLVLVEKAQLRALLGLDDCEDFCNRFPKIVATGQTG